MVAMRVVMSSKIGSLLGDDAIDGLDDASVGLRSRLDAGAQATSSGCVARRTTNTSTEHTRL